MKQQNSSLSVDIFNSYKQDILLTRDNLFSSISNNQDKIKRACKNLLTEKELENNSPLWGEIYPWFITDLLGASKNVIAEATKGWLAIYLHTVFIDKCLDRQNLIKPEELVASSLLAKEGLLNLQRIIIGTKYEKVFLESLNTSAEYELADVLNKLDFSCLNKKEEIAIGKNRIILACACALAALNQKQGDYIIALTNSLLLSLQFLDDLKDIEEDFKGQNYTYILSFAFRENPGVNVMMNKRQLLEKIFLSGALESVLTKISLCFKNSFQILSLINFKLIKETEAYAFLYQLNSEIKSLHSYLITNKLDYYNLPSVGRDIILDEIETRIYRCDLPS